MKMNNKHIGIILLSLLFYAFFLSSGRVNPVFAQSRDDIIWQAEEASEIETGADPLKVNLEKEIRKIVDAGHLRPFRALYGEVSTRYYWYEPGDMILTLARAYPYLSNSLQSMVQNYVRQELVSYPVWGTTLLNNQGTKREPDELTVFEWGSLPESTPRPKLWGLYALWLYAYNSNDWQVVDDNWSSITSFFNAHQSESNDSFSGIAGAIGVARMAQHRGDSGTETAAVAAAKQGMQNATATGGFLSFAQKAESVFKWGTNWDNWRKIELYMGFQFLNITPEIGRFINSETSLKNLVLGNNKDDPSFVYSATYGEFYFPLWFMAQGPEWSRYFEEGAGTPPDTRGMLFSIHAWVKNEKGDKLRYYTDTPDALVGDCYYIQNLATAIRSYGDTCWENLKTEEAECEAEAPPTQDVCPSGSEYKSFADSCMDSCWHILNPQLVCEQIESTGCDCGNDRCWDGFVCAVNPAGEGDKSIHYGIEELILLVKYWGAEGPIGDIDADSKVNINDLIILVRRWQT